MLNHATIQVGNMVAGWDSTFHGKLAHKATKTYEFQVTSPMIVSATLSGLRSSAELLLLDSKNARLAISSNGKGNDSFRYTFSPGTYFAKVIGMTKRKIKYQLEISATAPPISPPAATSSSTTAASSHSGGNPGGGNNGGGSTGGGNNGGGNTGGGNNGGGSSSGITVQQFANALSSAISKAVNNFATDATLVEVLAPTAYYSYLKPELLQVDEDSLNGENFQAFADIQTLGQTLFDEAVYTVYWGLPDTSALLGYSKVFTDLETVVALKEISFAFLDYLALRLPSPSTGSTPAVWTTGLLGNGSSSGLRTSPRSWR